MIHLFVCRWIRPSVDSPIYTHTYESYICVYTVRTHQVLHVDNSLIRNAFVCISTQQFYMFYPNSDARASMIHTLSYATMRTEGVDVKVTFQRSVAGGPAKVLPVPCEGSLARPPGNSHSLLGVEND